MTGYTVHTGASKKFVSGWDRVFGEPEKKATQADKTKSASKSGRKSQRKK